MAIGMMPTKAFSENLGSVKAGMANGPKLASEFNDSSEIDLNRLIPPAQNSAAAIHPQAAPNSNGICPKNPLRYFEKNIVDNKVTAVNYEKISCILQRGVR